MSGSVPDRPPLLTFGYGARSVEEVLDLLGSHGVGYVVDVRSAPWSRYQPGFSKDQFASLLIERGMRYVFMGQELGGRPEAPECYDAEGRVDYRACERQRTFRAGIERLRKAWEAGHPVALMCSEGRPEACHRTKLVARVAIAEGIEVRHIDERGVIRSQEEVLDRLRTSQTTLIEDESLVAKSRNRYRPVSA
jgi:uncharacterized protein (DUF488 family)